MPQTLTDSGLGDRERRCRIHSGAVFKFSATPGIAALTGLAGRMLEVRTIHIDDAVADVLSGEVGYHRIEARFQG